MSNGEKDMLKDKSKPFSNMRVAITSVDLEQAEHRGIAYLSKSLIRSLSEQGAEVYLLTGFYGRRLSPLMKVLMNDFSVNEVDSADILDQLSDPQVETETTEKKIDELISLYEKIGEKIISFRQQINQIIFLLKQILRFYIHRSIFSGKLIDLRDVKTSPYWGQERIDYLKYVNGFLAIPNIYILAALRSRRVLFNSPSIDLRKHNIDFLITTCPLSLNVKTRYSKSKKILQLIMDFIPLSFYKHPDHPYAFYNRLKDSMKYRCCFISQNSRNKICQLLGKKVDKYQNNIIYPMPSLNIETLELVSKLNFVRDINDKFILFNSSVVPRKNLHFLIQAFQTSGISSKGYKLCVAGKIHNDKYAERIESICENDSNIMLLGYVDEVEKSWLFLNAHAFASPSCVEGFGIPVLDAYILGIPVLASNIPSHQEIRSLTEVSGNLRLLDLTNIDSWISELKNIAEDQEYTILKSKRIDSFQYYLRILQERFDNKLYELISR